MSEDEPNIQSKLDRSKMAARKLRSVLNCLPASGLIQSFLSFRPIQLLILVTFQIASPAYAGWPVMQTMDEKTVLNLNTPENQIDLLECGMWVAKENGNFYLRNIKGKKIPVPKLAVKSILDRMMVDIALDAKLFGLQVRMMSVVYTGDGEYRRWGSSSWSEEKRKEKKTSGFLSQYTSFLIDGGKNKLTDAIHSSMAANPKLKDFTINYYPPEQKYGHLVIELLETSQLTQGEGGARLYWALLARGLSNTVNPPFFKVQFDGETGYIPMDSPYRHPAPHLQKKINGTKPIRTQLRYACVLGEDVQNAIPQ